MKSFKHGGGGGDMIYGLATMFHLGGGVLHLNIDKNKKFYKEMLELQPYIRKVVYHEMSAKDWSEFEVDYNLDLFRQQPFLKYPILQCHARAFNLKFDLDEPWLFKIKPKRLSPIVINDTGKLRWEGITVKWEYLEPYKKRCIFIGLPNEHSNFERDRFKIKHVKIKNSLEFAQIIKGSKLYVGNQSTGLAIAEGLKHPRVADLYIGRSKQFPFGDDGYYRLNEDIIRRYVSV
jgi:hypothetical protein